MNLSEGKRLPLVTALYLAFAAACALASARLFYGYMLQQTHGEWSAPLDDVFIHFDYARATARGYPFEWSPGNGYSSGSTSVLYPFALALGYVAGFQGPALMVWAAVLALVSVFGFLWAASELFDPLPAYTLPLAPLAIFSVGALSWSLWSGMEVAFFLGIWGAALASALRLTDERARLWPSGLLLGGAAAVLVLTRPEAASSAALLALLAASHVHRRGGIKGALTLLLLAGAPPALALGAHALANHVLTGETAANGALVKLAIYNPYLTAGQKLDEYLFNLDYVVDRMLLHHFGEQTPWGQVPVAFAAVGLFDARTRRAALLLWGSAACWVLVVAMNGQVRWQNERYVMPAVAWLLLAAALGAAVLIAPPDAARRPRAWVAGGLLWALALLVPFWRGERVQYRDQVWFFARASRNIRDQHLTAGRRIRLLDPRPRRILVGDAGALVYASDLPAFDLIGLGGFRDLPLARAGVQGLGATLELIERLAPADRPDVMAIYPSWWPALEGWFGERLFAVPVPGNVICGGAEKVVLRADWRLLGTGAAPRSLAPGERVVDELDPADLVNEREHRYAFPTPEGGYVEMRVLPDPRSPGRDLWDAGRRIPLDRSESFRLSGLPAGRPLRLVLRTAVDRASELEIAAGAFTARLSLPPEPGWRELSVDIPGVQVTAEMPVRITPRQGEWVHYHLWAVTVP